MYPPMTIGEARKIAGTLSLPSKMPGTGFGLPASACKTGSKLARVAGTVCSGCYALKGTYMRGNAQKAQRTRLRGLRDPLWAEAIITLLKWAHRGPIKADLGALGVRRLKIGLPRYIYSEPGWHRWHDSGDLQSVNHLAAICYVARRTPAIRHWLPTQELTMVRQFLTNGGVIPPNLVIRVSMPMVIGAHNANHRLVERSWSHLSSVFEIAPPAGAHICPAPSQDHKCGTCRACWSKDVPHVAYLQH